MKKTKSSHPRRRANILSEAQISFIDEHFKPGLEKLAPRQSCYGSEDFWQVSRKYSEIFNNMCKSNFKIKLKNTAVYTMAPFDISLYKRATAPDTFRFLDQPKPVGRTDEEAAQYFKVRKSAITNPGLTEPTVGKEQPSATLNSRTSGFLVTGRGPGTHFLLANVVILNSLIDFLEADPTRTESEKLVSLGKEIYFLGKRQKSP